MSLIKLVVKGISHSHSQNGAYALILDEVDGNRKLPIIIGAYEAQSIAIAIEEDVRPPRPLTHDLFKNFADEFNIKIKQIIIHKLVEGVFFSSLICQGEHSEQIIDARTSDAIALAVRFGAPIFTYKDIMNKAGVILNQHNEVVEEPQDVVAEPEDIISQVEQFLEDDAKVNDLSGYTIPQLESLLQQAIEHEDYERAARLRDELSNR